MSPQSDTNKFFNELKGIAEDIESMRIQIETMKHEVNYWRIEAQTDHDRWLRVLAENEELRKEVKRLTEFTTRTIIPNEILKAEVERLNSIIISGGAVVPDAKPFEE
jgi:DNA repair exonuclease SbcCD ATPase subunit